MAFIVFEGAEQLDAQTEVQREVFPNLPIILAKEGEIIRPILVIEYAAAAEAAVGSANQEFLERTSASRSVEEKELAVKYLREELVEIHARVFAAKAEYVSSLDPARGVHEVVIVLSLELVRRRRGTQLEACAENAEFVDRRRHLVGRPDDAQIIGGYRGNVEEIVADVDQAEAELVHEGRRKQMRFAGGE